MTALPVVFAGCSTTSDAGLKEIQQTINSRTGQTVEWPPTFADNDKTEQVLARLLAQDLTADAAVQIALLNNRSLRATLEEVSISRADLLQAALIHNPEFFASFRFPDRPPSAANLEYSLTADFLDLLLLPLRKRVAALQFEQTKLRVSHQILQLASEAKAAFYTVQARQRLLNRLQAIVEVNEAGVDLSLRQHKVGNITDLELANQSAAFQQAKLEWGKTQAQLRADRERLNRLLGLWGKNTPWKVGDELPLIPENEIELANLESLAITQRLDLAAARQQLALAYRALSLGNKTRYLPASIKLGVDTERETDRQRVTGPTLAFEVPIFDRGQAAIPRLQSQYRRAQWQTEALATDIRSEVRQARDAMTAARDLTDFYAKIYLPQRIRIVNETLLQYNAMQKGTLDLITAKERELSAEREYTEAWRDYWIARAELEKAVGGRLGVQQPATGSSHTLAPSDGERAGVRGSHQTNDQPEHQQK